MVRNYFTKKHAKQKNGGNFKIMTRESMDLSGDNGDRMNGV
jgi:hypothetical protein